MRGLRQDPAPRRCAQAAHAGRPGGGRGAGIGCADGLHRGRRAPDAPSDRRDRAAVGGQEEVRLPVHQRDAAAQEDGQVQALSVLRLHGAHRRAARAARRVRREGGRVRRGGRRHQGGQAARLPGDHQLHLLQHRHPADHRRGARLPQRRPEGGRDDDLARLRLRESPGPGALPGRRADPRAVQEGVLGRQPQEVAAQPLPALPGLPGGQGRLPVHRVGDPELLALRLAAPLLPDERRVRADLPGAGGGHRLGQVRPRQGPALRQLHGALRLRAHGRARHHGLPHRVAAGHARDGLRKPGVTR
ncbi:hypothetical protein SGPA1_10262 [Streptomyces misionensis JCM 4497]